MIRTRSRPVRRWARLLAAVAVVAGTALAAAPAAHASGGYVPISGSGSTWSQVAIDAWRVDVKGSGLNVNYTGNSSTAGRLDFIRGGNDFGVSEIPFQLHPEDGSLPEISQRPYAYLPIVAGGTSLMYHLTVGGRKVTDLRLSGETLTKIFTGVIQRWNDPAITQDYGHQLPNEPIVPVIRSDGSGTSAQFSLYMSKRYPALWNAFCVKYAHATPPCGLYSFYPGGFSPYVKAQNGSNSVANYVASSYAEGAITYVEYAYAKALGYPVVKLLNAAGYYTSPSASNVAVALTKAQINPDLTQNLDAVYTNPDPRTYPMSSYSYMIMPTTTAAPFNVDKGRSLSTFVNYFLCQGQNKAPNLGYSPLPLNLVQAGFAQVLRMPGHVNPPAIAQCNNPNFAGPDGTSSLIKNAPFPSPCDKIGAGSSCATGGGTGGGGGGGGSSSSTGGAGGGTGGSGGGGAAGGTAARGTNAAGGAAGGSGTAGGGAAATVDPDTGQLVNSAGTGQAGDAAAQIVPVASAWSDNSPLYGGMAAGELVLVLAIPPLAVLLLRRRRGGS